MMFNGKRNFLICLVSFAVLLLFGYTPIMMNVSIATKKSDIYGMLLVVTFLGIFAWAIVWAFQAIIGE